MRRLWRPRTSWLPRDLPRLVQGQDGQAVVAVLILVVVAALLLTPFLGQLATSLRKGSVEREQRFKILAAEAALQRTRGDLIRGADGVATTYTTQRPGFPATIYTIATAYTPPSVTVSGFTPTVTLTNPQVKPAEQPAYVDPGLAHPQLATVPTGNGYLLRLYNVKAGTVSFNWAYSPGGATNLGIWAGMPGAGPPTPPGQISVFPADAALLTRAVFSGTDNKLGPITVAPSTDGSNGVYTIVFFNNTGSTVTTAAFSSSGGTANTWVYATAYRDYTLTATVGSITVSVQFRQVPGFTEPPAVTGASPTFSYTWATTNVSFIPNDVFTYTWLSP